MIHTYCGSARLGGFACTNDAWPRMCLCDVIYPSILDSYMATLAQFAGSRSTTAAISSSVYILKPFSLVTLANCTFLESSFSSMTCLSVFNTKVSASMMVRD